MRRTHTINALHLSKHTMPPKELNLSKVPFCSSQPYLSKPFQRQTPWQSRLCPDYQYFFAINICQPDLLRHVILLDFFQDLEFIMSTSVPCQRANEDNVCSAAVRTSVCYKTADCNFDYCLDVTSGYEKLIPTDSMATENKALLRKLGFLDRFLVVWILLAMIIGVIIGYFIPNVQQSFQTVQFGSVSVPIAVGLLVMMYPVLCKIQYERLPLLLSKKSFWVQIGISIFINWIIGPIIMTALAWACLPDLPGFRTGVVMVGLARCIAMVLIWNTLAKGDEDYCAILVAINSIFQIALYSPYAVLFINIVPSWFGAAPDKAVNVGIWPVAQSVLIYLGIPLAAGYITRFTLRRIKGDDWYNQTFLPHFGPLALIGLLYTIVVMFANQGHHIIANIGSVCRVAVPLFCYFIIMFFIPLFVLKYALHLPYEMVVTQSFTAGSNNFELAIAVAVGTYGINSEQALAATIGPLIEVPVLVALVYITLYLKKRLQWEGNKQSDPEKI